MRETVRTRALHTHVAALDWVELSQYPAQLKQVLRFKRPVGASTSGIPHDEAHLWYIELDAGATYPLHRHPEPEVYYVVSGEAECTIGEATFLARAGTVMHTPPNTPHRIRNTGSDVFVALSFCWAPGGQVEVLHSPSELLEPVEE